MSTITERVLLINHELEVLRPAFAEYIKDKTIPLKDRWSLFSQANDALSEHSPWIEHFDDCTAENDIGNMGEYKGRGEVIKTVDWVEQLVEGGEIPGLPGYPDEGYDRDLTEEEWETASKKLDPLREEILEKNLKSFCFDW